MKFQKSAKTHGSPLKMATKKCRFTGFLPFGAKLGVFGGWINATEAKAMADPRCHLSIFGKAFGFAFDLFRWP